MAMGPPPTSGVNSPLRASKRRCNVRICWSEGFRLRSPLNKVFSSRQGSRSESAEPLPNYMNVCELSMDGFGVLLTFMVRKIMKAVETFVELYQVLLHGLHTFFLLGF